jgi:transcriptional regulator of acetoin/glycerol metabolism
MLDIESDAVPLLRPDGSFRTLKEIEDAVIDHALLKCRSLSQVARQLGIGRGTVYRKMKNLYR